MADHLVYYDCILCGNRLGFGQGRYPGRPVKAWGGVLICNDCRRSNWDGIVPESPRSSRLFARLQELAIEPVLNEKGWVNIPP